MSSQLGLSSDALAYTRGAVNIVLDMALALGASVLVFSVIVFAALVRGRPLQRARRQAIAALCAGRGLVPSVADDDFAILGPIEPHSLSNHFSSPEHAVAASDFTRSAGKEVEFFSLLAFRVAGLNMPYVAVTRRNFGGLPLGGPPTVELESTDFDERFTVKATDRRSAVMLLDPGMMQLLLDSGEINFDMVGDQVLAFVNRAALPRHQPAEPVEFEMLFKFWDGFVSRVPELLHTEYAAAQQR